MVTRLELLLQLHALLAIRLFILFLLYSGAYFFSRSMASRVSRAEALSVKKHMTCALCTLITLAAGVLSTNHHMCFAWSAWSMSDANTHIFCMQNVSKEAEKTAGNIADAAPQIADRVSDRLVKEADQVGREVKPAADKAAKRLSSEADQLGKEARPMADKASANIEAGARQAGEQARPAADKASAAMKKGANDASGEQRDTHCNVHHVAWLCQFCCCWLCTLHSLPCWSASACLCMTLLSESCAELCMSNAINFRHVL